MCACVDKQLASFKFVCHIKAFSQREQFLKQLIGIKHWIKIIIIIFPRRQFALRIWDEFISCSVYTG